MNDTPEPFGLLLPGDNPVGVRKFIDTPGHFAPSSKITKSIHNLFKMVAPTQEIFYSHA